MTDQMTHADDEVGEITASNQPTKALGSYDADLELVTDHLRQVGGYFTTALTEEIEKRTSDIIAAQESRGRGGAFMSQVAPFSVNAEHAIAGLTKRNEVRRMAKLIRKGGKGLHLNQIKTLVASLIESSLELTKPGVVLGPMQSGKTGTALAHALFLAPLMYALTRVKFYPMFLSTHLDQHATQTRNEFNAVLMLYGNLLLEVKDGIDTDITPGEYYNMVDAFEASYRDSKFIIDSEMNEEFAAEPTPLQYREEVLRDELGNPFENINLVYNRRSGPSVALLREKMAAATKRGFSLLLLVDEPQFGASGDLRATDKTDRNGRTKYAGTVIRQIMADINEELLQADGKHMAILFSATPFDSFNMANVWKVRSYLSPNYVGYNCWLGEKIDPTVWFRTPKLRSFDEIAEETSMPDIAELKSLLVKPGGKSKKPSQVDFTRGGPAVLALLNFLTEERAEVANEIRDERPDLNDRLDAMLQGIAGGCIRFVNDNPQTDAIIDATKLEDFYQVFRYYGGNYEDEQGNALPADIVLDTKYDPSNPKPPLFVVTNGARMGDNIPRIVEFYIDLSESSSDLNALLQGLNGRACGESKFLSQVVLSEKPIGRLRDYIHTMGVPVGKASPHAESAYGSAHKMKPTKIAKINIVDPDQASDPLVQEFMRLINERIIGTAFTGKVKNLSNAATNDFDLRGIFNDVTDADGRNFYDYLCDPQVQSRLFPNMGTLDIVSPFDDTQTVKHTTKKGQDFDLWYDVKDDGDMAVSFRSRHTDHINTGHYGATNRAARRVENADGVVVEVEVEEAAKRRASYRAAVGLAGETPALEIQVNCRKLDDKGNELPADTEDEGFPDAYMITFPLTRKTVPTPIVTGQLATIAKRDGWIAGLAAEAEVAVWDESDMAKAERAAKRAKVGV